MKSINPFEKIKNQYTKNLPFVCFASPGKEDVTLLLQNDDSLNEISTFKESGFVFAPFDYDGFAYIIFEEEENTHRFSIEETADIESPMPLKESEEDKTKYTDLVELALKEIKNLKATKIVVSRQKEIPIPEFDIQILVEQILSSNKNAFRYVWYHPETGLWCGATPEILVKINNGSFHTMSLAGTQKYNGTEEVKWAPKEIHEQELVTDSIVAKLEKVTSVLKISKVYTYRASSLLHLRTDISGFLKTGKATLNTISNALHPTPAVCGTPTAYAKDFILRKEGYPREFYTGFLGPINTSDSTTELMVNLRCMKIENDIAGIYIGGGITFGSNPEMEWQETQNKMQTMLQILSPMLLTNEIISDSKK